MATADSIRDDLEQVQQLINEIIEFAEWADTVRDDLKWPWLLRRKADRLVEAFDAVHIDVTRTALPLLRDMQAISSGAGR